MTQPVVQKLESIAALVKKSSPSLAVSAEIQNSRNELAKFKTSAQNAVFQALDEELGIWFKKIDAVLKDSGERDAMVKNMRRWIEKLKKFGAGN